MPKKVTREQYEALRVLIESGHIKTFNQVFDTVKRTNFAEDLGMNYQTFMYRLQHPASFSYRESFAIANLIGVEKQVISRLIIAQYEARSKK